MYSLVPDSISASSLCYLVIETFVLFPVYKVLPYPKIQCKDPRYSQAGVAGQDVGTCWVVWGRCIARIRMLYLPSACFWVFLTSLSRWMTNRCPDTIHSGWFTFLPLGAVSPARGFKNPLLSDGMQTSFHCRDSASTSHRPSTGSTLGGP